MIDRGHFDSRGSQVLTQCGDRFRWPEARGRIPAHPLVVSISAEIDSAWIDYYRQVTLW